SAPKPKVVTSKPKLKGVQSLTPTEKEAADIMQALKESKKTRKRQPEKVILKWGSEQESEYSEKDQLDDEEKDDKKGDADDEGDDHINEDEEMLNAEVEVSRKGDAEVFDAAKADAKKTEEAKDDSKKAELPPTSSSLSISSGFGDQFLKLSFDTSLVGTVKDTTDAKISSLLDIKIQSEVLHIQSPSILRVPVSVISELTVLTLVQETKAVKIAIPPVIVFVFARSRS
ncbi:hypothetical protein Tco_0489445, partial [Tanacetum coccineum]